MKVMIEKVRSGYILTWLTSLMQREPEVCVSFEDRVDSLALYLGEKEFREHRHPGLSRAERS